MQIYKYIIYLFLFSAVFPVSGQNMTDMESELKHLFDSMYARNEIRFLRTDKEKSELNDSILRLFESSLRQKDGFEHEYSSILQIKNLRSKDGHCRIITWNLKYSDGSFRYYGYVQYSHPSKMKVFTWPLTDLSDSIQDPENTMLGPEKWYGAVYYGMHEYEDGGKPYYVLFGWDGFSYYTNRKILDVLTFTSAGKPVFGKSVFRVGRKTLKRMIFEYSVKATMNLLYDNKAGGIVFDHLVPSSSSQQGDYQFYGPDGTSDGFVRKGGKWNFVEDIYVINPKGEKKNFRPKEL